MRWALAVATGTSHQRAGTECQDYALCQQVRFGGQECLVAIVSDGAGSAARGAAGARAVCHFLTNDIIQLAEAGLPLSQLNTAFFQNYLNTLSETLTERAEVEGLDLREYSATALCAVLGPEMSVLFQVGDGAIVVAYAGDAPGQYTLAFWPEHGEYANSTVFATDAEAPAKMHLAVQPRCIAQAALFTDGLERLALNAAGRCAHHPFFRHLFKSMEGHNQPGLDDEASQSLQAFLESEQVCQRTDDDKTIILYAAH